VPWALGISSQPEIQYSSCIINAIWRYSYYYSSTPHQKVKKINKSFFNLLPPSTIFCYISETLSRPLSTSNNCQPLMSKSLIDMCYFYHFNHLACLSYNSRPMYLQLLHVFKQVLIFPPPRPQPNGAPLASQPCGMLSMGFRPP